MMKGLLLNRVWNDTNVLLSNCLNFPAGMRQMKGADILLIKILKVRNSVFGISLHVTLQNKISETENFHRGVA